MSFIMNRFPELHSSELFNLSDQDLLTASQADILKFIQEAENDPEKQAELAYALEKRYGMKVIRNEDGQIQVLPKNSDTPEDVVQFWRDAFTIAMAKKTPKDKLN